MFFLPILESLLRFSNVKIIAIPATSFMNDFGFSRAIKAVLVWKDLIREVFRENYLGINTVTK